MYFKMIGKIFVLLIISYQLESKYYFLTPFDLFCSHWNILVHWDGLPESEANWEDYAKMITLFPNEHLEDKVQLLAAGMVTPEKKLLTYKRRNKLAK